MTDDDEDDILNDTTIGSDSDQDNDDTNSKANDSHDSRNSDDSDDSDGGGATRKLSAREPQSRKRRRSRSRDRSSDSDNGGNNNRSNGKRFKRKQTKRASTKIFTSFGAGNKFRKENDLEPKKKRRRTGGRGRQNGGDGERKKKPKKIRNCAVCQKELNEDNLGKYCGEACKKEGYAIYIHTQYILMNNILICI